MLLLVCGEVGAIGLVVASWVIAHTQEGEIIILADGVLFAQSFRASGSNRIVSVWLVVEVVALARRHCGRLCFTIRLLGGLGRRWGSKMANGSDSNFVCIKRGCM